MKWYKDWFFLIFVACFLAIGTIGGFALWRAVVKWMGAAL